MLLVGLGGWELVLCEVLVEPVTHGRETPCLWRRPAGEAEETGFSLERVAGLTSASHETNFQPRGARKEHRRERRGGGVLVRSAKPGGFALSRLRSL